ncbi:MAG TPA: hypothetical protein ENH31_00490 [Nitrospirae bacterium]|nr:hypothetical protein [Nitrospirota bacterium]
MGVTKYLKQASGSSNCVAVAAAMATGTTVEEFERFIGHDIDYDGPYGDLDFYRYMLHKGYVAGVGVVFSKDYLEGKTVRGQLFESGEMLYEYPAYVVVESRKEGYTHAVYWDGKKIHDPDPTIDGTGLPLKEYKVIFWLPIYKIEQDKK